MKLIKHLNKQLVFVIPLIFFSFTSPVFAEDNARTKYEDAKNLIHEYSGKGDHYKRAINLAEEIFHNDPSNPFSYLILAELKSRQYKDNKQKQSLPIEIMMLTNIVISLDNNIAGPYVINAKMASLRNDLEEARINLNKAMSIEPKNLEGTYEFAILEQSEGNFEKSEEFFKQTIALHTSPDRKSNIYYWLAEMYLKMHPENIKKADKAMFKMAELSPNAPWKLVNYSIFLNTKTTKYDESIKYAEQSLKQMNFKMGYTALGMGMYAKWAEIYKKNEFSLLSRSKEMERLKQIESTTGITISYAKNYALTYMPLSSISQAFSALEL